jgi:hypothetical protein
MFSPEGAFLHQLPVWLKNSNPAVEIQENKPARFPETDLKQVFWKSDSGGN